MAENIKLHPVERDGRTLSPSVAWWYDNGDGDNLDRLYCIHNVKLSAKCEDCDG